MERTMCQDDWCKPEDICLKAVKFFGIRSQEDMAIEEMNELAIALFKNRRDAEEGTEGIAEEIADVEIMMEQLKLAYDLSRSVEQWKAYKKERLAKLIKEKQGLL